MMDVTNEIVYQTTRSGGKGGQNVNKVETAVIAFFDVENSASLTIEQKSIVKDKLANRINQEGWLMVKSQTHRTQLANKKEATEKLNELLTRALQKKKPRIATRISKASKEKRLETKKKRSEVKAGRRFRYE